MKRKLILIMTVVLTTWGMWAGVNPHITELDLNIDGVDDDKEFLEPAPSTTPNGPGGFVAINGWRKITLSCTGVNPPMKTRLNWNSDKIEVWTAPGGALVPNNKQWDTASDMPHELWVKGINVSATGPTATTCGPEHMCLEAINNGAPYLYDRVALTVIRLDVKAIPAEYSPVDLESGRMCVNVQPQYKEAKWRTIIEPSWVGGNATVTSLTPGIAIKPPGATAVPNDTRFWVQTTAAWVIGDYKIQISLDSDPACTMTRGEKVFKFVSIYNPGSTGPSGASCYQGSAYCTDTKAGEWPGSYYNQNGEAYLNWKQGHYDSTYVSVGIGDSALDVYPNFPIGWANNSVHHWSDKANCVPYYTQMYDSGRYQTETYPEKNLFAGHLNWSGTLTWKTRFINSVKVAPLALEFSVGASGYGFGCGISESVDLDGGVGTRSFVSALWDGRWTPSVLDYSEDGLLYGGTIQSQTKDNLYNLSINDDSSYPWETTCGFAAGFLVQSRPAAFSVEGPWGQAEFDHEYKAKWEITVTYKLLGP